MKTIIISLLISIFAFGQNELPSSSEKISPLLISEKIPNATVQSIDSTLIKTDKILKDKKTVLLFYRGGWCPYCNQHLSEIAGIENKIMELGYQIVAISPDAPSFLKKTITKDAIHYSLFSDSSGEFSRSMGIAFEAPLLYKPIIKNSSNKQNSTFIPVPSLFVVNEKQEIIFEYISPDYKNRISSDLLLSVLTSLNKE